MSILIKHFLLQLSQYAIIRLGEFSYSGVPNRPEGCVPPIRGNKLRRLIGYALSAAS